MIDALIIGGGPAGLMAATRLAAAGKSVTVIDAMPTVARKFLMAGKSGLNLTTDAPFEAFLAPYDDHAEHLKPILQAFDNTAVQDWAIGLGQDLFTGSTGRVFPKVMKASPLLRAWLRNLADAGVQFQTKWRWIGWDGEAYLFETPEENQKITPKTCVLALGGASWAKLGSNGAWAKLLADKGVEITPFKPANMGFEIDWSSHMGKHFGHAVKGVELTAGSARSRGEFVISKRGIEGGGIYTVSKAMRDGASLEIDLLPDWTRAKTTAQISRSRGKTSLGNHLRKTLKLTPEKLALLFEFGQPLPKYPKQIAHLIKALPIKHNGPRPIDEAISTAGGVAFSGLTEDLELKSIPNLYCVGEMLDWEAPTGGYLLSACLATGDWAGRAAARKLG